MGKEKEAIAGGLSGAAAGSAVLPGWGTAAGAVIGFLGGLFGSPDSGGGDAQLLDKINQVGRMYEQQGERNRLGRQEALANQIGLFAPMNRLLGSIGGGKANQIDFSNVLNDPIYDKRNSMFPAPQAPTQGTPASLPEALDKRTPGHKVDPMMLPETDLGGVGASGLNDPLPETGVGSLTGPPGGSGPFVPVDEPYAVGSSDPFNEDWRSY